MHGKLRAIAACTSAHITPQGRFQAANPVLSPLKHTWSPLQEPHFRVSLCSQDRYRSCPGSHHTQEQETTASRRRQQHNSATSIPARRDARDFKPKRGKHEEYNSIGGIRTNPFLVAQNSVRFPLPHEQKNQVLRVQQCHPQHCSPSRSDGFITSLPHPTVLFGEDIKGSSPSTHLLATPKGMGAPHFKGSPHSPNSVEFWSMRRGAEKGTEGRGQAPSLGNPAREEQRSPFPD